MDSESAISPSKSSIELIQVSVKCVKEIDVQEQTVRLIYYTKKDGNILQITLSKISLYQDLTEWGNMPYKDIVRSFFEKDPDNLMKIIVRKLLRDNCLEILNIHSSHLSFNISKVFPDQSEEAKMFFRTLKEETKSWYLKLGEPEYIPGVFKVPKEHQVLADDLIKIASIDRSLLSEKCQEWYDPESSHWKFSLPQGQIGVYQKLFKACEKAAIDLKLYTGQNSMITSEFAVWVYHQIKKYQPEIEVKPYLNYDGEVFRDPLYIFWRVCCRIIHYSTKDTINIEEKIYHDFQEKKEMSTDLLLHRFPCNEYTPRTICHLAQMDCAFLERPVLP